jgi:hypothetical protein
MASHHQLNFWFDHIIDAYLEACAKGEDWREACATAEQKHGDRPRRVLTHQKLKSEKGIDYSRQHIARKIDSGGFPPPFKLADNTT